MMRAIEILMEEHQLIYRAMDVARSMAERLVAGEEVPVEDLTTWTDFVSQYADSFHHAKEEDQLFPWMIERGFSVDTGPIHCMLADHRMNREFNDKVKELTVALPGSAEELAGGLREFAEHLTHHAQKEDQVLYPMARQLGDGDAELLPAYDRAVPDAEAIEARFQAVVKLLEERYP
jgi:hemerythrin-like domain-containing protein